MFLLFHFTEEEWKKIQRFAGRILEDYGKGQLMFQIEGTQSFKPRFAFTRSVSRKVYNEQLKNCCLRDGAATDLVCESY